jgi:hypothetical protein
VASRSSGPSTPAEDTHRDGVGDRKDATRERGVSDCHRGGQRLADRGDPEDAQSRENTDCAGEMNRGLRFDCAKMDGTPGHSSSKTMIRAASCACAKQFRRESDREGEGGPRETLASPAMTEHAAMAMAVS